MASQSFLRVGVQSPARSLMRPLTSKSILKRPAPLPLSPSPFTANFSVVMSASKGSAHVHFPASPSLAATFTAHSANTYDRGAIITSPASADHSSWMGRMLSPTAHNAFKLSDVPKRTPGLTKKEKRATLAPPPAAITVSSTNNLAPPSPFVDPRSPKPYVPRAGVSFEEVTLYVPRTNVAPGDLGRALTTYPRSPYPSAPLETEEGDVEMVTRGRPIERTDAPSGVTRTRSLENKTRRRQAAQNLLSPVRETPRVAISSQPTVEITSPETRLNQEFWAAVTLQDAPVAGRSINSIMSPRLMFAGQDGTLWSPRPAKRESRSITDNGFLSPAPRPSYKKGMVASPSPNDPFASFPSFTVALKNMDGIVAYPPRARVE